MTSLYHDGMRRLQDARETRRLAERLANVTVRQAFTDEDRAFIARCSMFFLATADAEGRPDCSYKGGLPGFAFRDTLPARDRASASSRSSDPSDDTQSRADDEPA